MATAVMAARRIALPTSACCSASARMQYASMPRALVVRGEQPVRTPTGGSSPEDNVRYSPWRIGDRGSRITRLVAAQADRRDLGLNPGLRFASMAVAVDHTLPDLGKQVERTAVSGVMNGKNLWIPAKHGPGRRSQGPRLVPDPWAISLRAIRRRSLGTVLSLRVTKTSTQVACMATLQDPLFVGRGWHQPCATKHQVTGFPLDACAA